uniref:Uncharacterized protein n=1 Tax=Oryza nivara TaxID=4536 RepID=A0A0E0I3Q2_ORYNI
MRGGGWKGDGGRATGGGGALPSAESSRRGSGRWQHKGEVAVDVRRWHEGKRQVAAQGGGGGRRAAVAPSPLPDLAGGDATGGG